MFSEDRANRKVEEKKLSNSSDSGTMSEVKAITEPLSNAGSKFDEGGTRHSTRLTLKRKPGVPKEQTALKRPKKSSVPKDDYSAEVSALLSVAEDASGKHTKEEVNPYYEESSAASGYKKTSFFLPSPSISSPKQQDTSGLTHSEDSTPIRFKAKTTKKRVLGCEFENGELYITQNNHRVSTKLGNTQGDHTTSYATMLQLIFSLVDDVDVQDVPEFLFEASSLLIKDEEAIADFQAKYKDSKEKLDINLPLRKDRKDFIASAKILAVSETAKKIRTGEILFCYKSGESIEDKKFRKALDVFNKKYNYILEAKQALKQNELSPFAEFIVEMGNHFIETLNRGAFAVLRKLKKEKKSDTEEDSEEQAEDKKSKNDGNMIKEALFSLKILNRFLLLKKELKESKAEDEKDEKIANFIDACENIAYITFQITNSETFYSRFEGFFHKLYEIKIGTGIDPDWIKKNIGSMELDTSQVGSLFNQLLDLKASKIDKATEDEEDGSVRITKEHRKVEKKIVFFDPANVLYEVSAIHLMIVFLAFKNLSELEEKERNDIINSFLEEVVCQPTEDFPNRQGWQIHDRIIKGEMVGKITKEAVLHNIQKTLGSFFKKHEGLYDNKSFVINKGKRY